MLTHQTSNSKNTFYKLISLPFIVGLIAIVGLLLPGYILGEGSYVQIQDQLDGEIIAYIYRAKYLFSGSNLIPEFMTGMNKSALTMPAPAAVILYKLFSPYIAYEILYTIEVVAGYVGMYMLISLIGAYIFEKEDIHELSIKEQLLLEITSCICGVLFAYLPFYPVYGLSVYGQPMLILALICLYRNKRTSIVSICAIIIYALFSSLVLIGFIWLIFTASLICIAIFKRKSPVKPLTAFLSLLIPYVACNYNLIAESLKITESYPLHREEMLQGVVPASLERFTQLYIKGGDYVWTYSQFLVVLIVLSIIMGVIFKFKPRILRLHVLLQIIMIAIASFAVFWRCETGTNLRNHLGGIWNTFSLDRVYWTLPLLWYLSLGISLIIIFSSIARSKQASVKVTVSIISALLTFACAIIILQNSLLNINIRLLLIPSYDRMTWEDYYAEDLFENIEKDIATAYSIDKSSYKCASIGINPAAALYNGFYTLDGYSNMYSLDYKHSFRPIISSELDKNDYIKGYFDKWGNRCYMFNAQTADNLMIPANSGIIYSSLDYNTGVMHELGCRFIFSAAPIEKENADKLGLSLFGNSPYSSADSYYSIYVYEIIN